MAFVNISAYKFVRLDEERLPALREQLFKEVADLQFKGTILISPEGINMFLAGTQDRIQAFKAYINTFPEFVDLPYKDSYSDYQPFRRLLVRIKKEIIAMGIDSIKPEDFTAPYVSAKELKQWYDENHDMVILDTRNDYEVKLGTFENAKDLELNTFREFEAAIDKMTEEAKQKKYVTFCTGGIRCEKAAALMLKKGFKDVYQLEGGILKYFEEVGGEHYEGDCFVFDHRVAVDPALNETETIQCFACRQPLTKNEQFAVKGECPHCHDANPLNQG
jgi:predicted sulfurtransferase